MKHLKLRAIGVLVTCALMCLIVTTAGHSQKKNKKSDTTTTPSATPAPSTSPAPNTSPAPSTSPAPTKAATTVEVGPGKAGATVEVGPGKAGATVEVGPGKAGATLEVGPGKAGATLEVGPSKGPAPAHATGTAPVTKPNDERSGEAASNPPAGWQKVFSPSGDVNFKTVYSSASVPPGTHSTLWLGDDKGSLWVNLGPSASTTLPLPIKRVTVENQDRAEMADPWGVNALLFDQGTGYFLRGNTLYQTDNAGYNWTAAYRDRLSGLPRSPLTAKFLSLASTPTHACLAGVYLQENQIKDSLVICSAKPLGNGDPQWNRVTVPNQTQLFHVFFFGDQHGWIVGKNGTILKSDDGGKVWIKITVMGKAENGPENGVERPDGTVPLTLPSLLQVYFVNENEGWIVGRSGTILHSTDGGSKWQLSQKFRDQLSDIDLRSVRFASDNKQGWIVGDKGTILHTRNGRDWELQKPLNDGKGPEANDTADTLNALFVDDTYCWAVGHNVVWRYRWR